MPPAEGRPSPPGDRPLGPVAGVVLAAGAASRMGSNKLLLRVGGEALVRGAVRRALAAGLEPVVVVLGHEAERVAGELGGLPCETVLNPRYRSGIQTSVAAGISHLEGRASAAVVILADMPRVGAEMVRTLVERYRASGAPLVVSSYGATTAPPILYDRALFGELRAMETRCGKEVVRRHLAEAVLVRWPESALLDIDAPGDYEALLAGPRSHRAESASGRARSVAGREEDG